MKKLLLILGLSAGISFAAHHFNVCYYNWSNSPINYNNNGIKYKWKARETLAGSGKVESGQKVCFTTKDETMMFSHVITFYVNNKWIGIVNPAFARPYVIAEDATSKSHKDGKLQQSVDVAGQEQCNLNVHILNDGSQILSTGNDPKDITSRITPRINN